jgi:N-dimethylarginine dimethylaminohydrolase
MDDYAYPVGFGVSLCPAEAEPAFETDAQQELVWGRRWGATDEVGPLRQVLMRAPGDEFARVRTDCWDERAQALVDPAGGWYWESREAPDLGLIQSQHAGLVAALEAEGVDVVLIEEAAAAHLSRPIYTRDPLCTVPGGAIIGRMAPTMRRGEERAATQAVAELGMPILRTIHGTGLLEGGSFVKLTPQLSAYGTSFRCNPEGARQLREVLDVLGIELLVFPLPGWSIHIDGHIGMVDVDKALVDAAGLPYWFLDRLAAEGIEAIPCPAGEEWAINSLTVRPGRVLMCDGYPRAREALERRGVEVVAVAYDEVQKGGGGVHCSTMELVRDPAR